MTGIFRVWSGILAGVVILGLLQGVMLLARRSLFSIGICNPAGPFGLAVSFWLLGGVFLLASAFFLWQWWHEKDSVNALFWLLLFSAGASNMLERLWYGCVFDFLHLPGLPYFNVADILLTASVVFLVWKQRKHIP